MTLLSSIVFLHSLGGEPGCALSDIVTEYNETHREKVELKSVGSDYAAAARAALTESGTDLVLVPEYMTGEYQKTEHISISSLLDQERVEDIAEIVKRTFGTDSLPFNPSCGVLYMNKTILSSCGFSPEWRPVTLNELIEASKIIKERGKAEYGYTCAWPEAYLVEVVLAQSNKPLVDEHGYYMFSSLADHIIDLHKLTKENIFLPPNTTNYDPTRTDFINGKVAFYMQGSGHSSAIEKEAKEKGFEVIACPLPTLSNLHTGQKFAFPLGGAAIWALKTSDAVKEFLNYMASKEVQAKWHEKTVYVPVSRSVRQILGDEFYQSHPLHDAVIKQTIEAPLGNHSFGIKKVGYSEVRKKVYPMIRKLLTLEGTPEEVAHTIKERLKAFDDECNSKVI